MGRILGWVAQPKELGQMDKTQHKGKIEIYTPKLERVVTIMLDLTSQL